MAVATVGELSSKYPRWNFAIVSSLTNDRIGLDSTPNSEDSYICKAINNPTSQTVYVTAPCRTKLEAANAMDAILSNINANTKFASVSAQLRLASGITVFGRTVAEIGGGGIYVGEGGGPLEEQPG